MRKLIESNRINLSNNDTRVIRVMRPIEKIMTLNKPYKEKCRENPGFLKLQFFSLYCTIFLNKSF